GGSGGSGAFADDGPSLAARFAAAHAARYGFTLPADAEIVALRHESGAPARAVHFAHDANSPAPGTRIAGPATIALPDATLFVAEGWQAEALPIGGWMLEAAPTAAPTAAPRGEPR